MINKVVGSIKLNKSIYYLNEDGIIEIIIKNNFKENIYNISFQQIESEFYSIYKNKISINYEPYILGINSTLIKINTININEQIKILIPFKINKISSSEAVSISGKLTYEYCENIVIEELITEAIVKGVNISINNINRNKDIIFENEILTYNLTLKNTGNIAASNLSVRYASQGNLVTHKNEVIVDGVLIRKSSMENGLHLGSLFKNEERKLSFDLTGSKVNTNRDFDYILIQYECVVNPLTKPEKKYINHEISPVKVLKDNIDISTSCSLIIKDDTWLVEKKIIISNNTNSDIVNFLLMETWNFHGEIIEINADYNNVLKEGNQIKILNFENNKTLELVLIIKPIDDTLFAIGLKTTAFYNLGNHKNEKRFKKSSNEILLNLDMKNLQISDEILNSDISLNDTFERKIAIVNKSSMDIYRVIFFDKYSQRISIIPGSFKINGNKINNLQYDNTGFELGDMKGKSTIIISYKGYFKGPFVGRIVNVESYCKYRVNYNNEEYLDLKSNVIKNLLEISSTKLQFILAKNLDVGKFDIKELTNFKVSNTVYGFKMLKDNTNIKTSIVNYKNYLLTGSVEINIEYYSISNNHKVSNINFKWNFEEVVRVNIIDVIPKSNWKPDINMDNISYRLNGNILELTINSEFKL